MPEKINLPIGGSFEYCAVTREALVSKRLRSYKLRALQDSMFGSQLTLAL